MEHKDKWIEAGFISTIIIVLSVPLYLVKHSYLDQSSDDLTSEPQFVGKETCIDCHKLEYDLWTGSDHDLAMDFANDSTVVGDFNNAELSYYDQIHKLYKKDGKYYAFTEGPDGKMQEFEVKYTFGVHPLQQYLIEFPGGRLQTLPLTWDTISKSWYHMAEAVYPDEIIEHSNWLHWTNQAQNWNGMCADCHSTNLKKGFDINTETFNTTWSEIDVSCEACHGPSSEHIKWANLPEMARPQNINTGLIVQTSNIDNHRYVDLCARCHTRRSALRDYNFDWTDLLDHMIPELPMEPMYFADGQILEEDYVFGSFTQSRMYMEDVKCNDCHNVHSGKLILDGNDLCLQCHRSDVYDTYNHHFHKYEGEGNLSVIDEFGLEQKVGLGAQCINCHMPGRYYMGADYRRDHSFRVPRPDLSDELGTPNACIQCHANQTNSWAAGYLKKWYGESTNPHYGLALAAGTHMLPGALDKLIRLSTDDLYPVIIRATALSILGENYPDSSKAVFTNSLKDLESLIRYTSIRHFPFTGIEDIENMIPLLNDPVKAVRFEAAITLSQVPDEHFPQDKKRSLEEALIEYKKAMEYSADFAASRHNLGNYYSNIGNPDKAIEQYNAAIKIDDLFYPAKVNLAMIYNQQGENDKAELIFRDILKANPELSEIYYSFGLLLAEQQKYEEASELLLKAVELIPNRMRIYYNLGLIYQYIGDNIKSEKVLLDGLSIHPDDFDLLFALADLYVKTNKYDEAKPIGQKLKDLYPQSSVGGDILKAINQK